MRRFREDDSSRTRECFPPMSAQEPEGRACSGDPAGSSHQQFEKLIEVISRSQHAYRELIDSLDQALFTVTLQGEIRVANLRLSEILGAPFQDFIGHSLAEFVESPTLQEAESALPTLLKRGVWSGTLPVKLKKDEMLRYYSCWFQAVMDGDKVTSVTGWVRDITERLEIEKQLHEEREFTRRLVDFFPDMIAVVDHDGRFIYVSEHSREILGIPPQEFIGRAAGEQGPAESLAGIGQVLEKVMSRRQSSGQVEFRAQHADGSWRTLRATASPMFDAEGNHAGAVASVRDVTEAKIAEQQLVEKEKFAAMGQMLAGAAHELNNPLTAILGISELIRDKCEEGLERRQADLIFQQARRAAGIVQSLLVFSRPSAAERSRLNLADIVQEILHSLRDEFAGGKIQVEFSPPRDLPVIEGDRRQLRQVFLNILKNAQQAISAGRASGTIRISLSQAGPRVCATIMDDGPGISSDHLGKVFDPFFSTKRPGGGSGMGLTISLAIVREHGGTIEAESAPGGGAVFHLYFPVPAAGAVPAAPKPAARGASDLSGHSVLVVDDEEGIREIVCEGLRARGMKVDTAESCEDALSLLAAGSYEIVLCDFNLSGMSGERFFEQIRGKHGDSAPRFVLMTGELLDAPRAEELQRHGAVILQKPFDLRKLAELLSGMLETRPAGVP